MNHAFSANRQASRNSGLPYRSQTSRTARMLARLTGWPPPELFVTVSITSGTWAARPASSRSSAATSMLPLNGCRSAGCRPSGTGRLNRARIAVTAKALPCHRRDARAAVTADPRPVPVPHPPLRHPRVTRRPERRASPQPADRSLGAQRDHARQCKAGEPQRTHRRPVSGFLLPEQDTGAQIQHPEVPARGRVDVQLGPTRARKQMLTGPGSQVCACSQDQRHGLTRRLLHRAAGREPRSAQREETLLRAG